jgi:hypothetical protein
VEVGGEAVNDNMKEDDFLNELEVFRKEFEACMQFFYAYQAINDVLEDNKKALNIINRTPLLWLTISGALEASFFIALTRIFDRNPKTHNVGRLLQIAKSNIDFFSAKALETRKRKSRANDHEWIDEFMRDIYVPTIKDFQRLERYVERYRNISIIYVIIRHNIFGHRQRLNFNGIHNLYSQTSIRDIQKLLVFLKRLHDCLLMLFNDGRKPLLGPMRFSIKSIRKKPKYYTQLAHEEIINQTQKFFDLLSLIPDNTLT